MTRSSRMLWVMNSGALGGSGLWVLDAVRSLPEWAHDVIHLNPPADPALCRRFAALGVGLRYETRVTPALVEELAPEILVLSNTEPERIDGPPWRWLLQRQPTISVHHSYVQPWIAGADADMFVSRFLMSHYRPLPATRRTWLLPPGIHTADYARIERGTGRGPVRVGRISSRNAAKYPPELLSILEAVGCPAVVVGGAKHYPQADRAQFDFPEVGERTPVEILSAIDVFIYRTNLTETWCRAVTEAMAAGLPVVAEKKGGIVEQIEDGVDGFLCDSDAEMVERTKQLVRDPQLRMEMGMRARAKAVANFDVAQFRSTAGPLLAGVR
jgi:glycosyltransferase involved in cell wall biosynthesis